VKIKNEESRRKQRGIAATQCGITRKNIMGALPPNPLLAREPKVLASSPPQAACVPKAKPYSGFFRMKDKLKRHLRRTYASYCIWHFLRI
jgi:hypothetical protein